MSVVAAVPAESPDSGVQDPAEKKERDIVIVDVNGDGKTIQYTTSFTMTWKDRETGKVQVGTFTAQRPNLGQLGQIEVLQAKLNGGEKVTFQTNNLHMMIASLQIILIDYPKWWTPEDFFTADPLREVWDHVRSWVDSFRKPRVE